ncbi:MAG TPA: hypothetical protein VFI95_25335, partial [Terriglobales bacterium]|nr:hypothetical protein [Terriglobales bacterium]
AGMSRRYGGIHFRAADLMGRLLGRMVACQAWTKAQDYFNGTAREKEHVFSAPEPVLTHAVSEVLTQTPRSNIAAK